MISFNVASPGSAVVRNRDLFAHLEAMRLEAGEQMRGAFGTVAGKRIDAVNVPGCGRHAVSRGMNSSETNPLYRFGLLLIVMKRLGMNRRQALQWLEWMRGLIDRIWPEGNEVPLQEVLDKDAQLDAEDDVHRLRASHGCSEAARRLIDVKQRQCAQAQETIAALQRITEAG